MTASWNIEHWCYYFVMDVRSWIYIYLCNKFLSPLTLWVRITIIRGVLNTTFCDNVCVWLGTGRWFSPVSPTNKADRHDIAAMFFKHHNPITLNSESRQEYCPWIVFIRNYCTFFVIITGHQIFFYWFFNVISRDEFVSPRNSIWHGYWSPSLIPDEDCN